MDSIQWTRKSYEELVDIKNMLMKQAEPRFVYNWEINEPGTEITTKFNPPIDFPPGKDYEIGVTGLNTYYSFPNIDPTNNKFVYSVDSGATWKVIEIPTGSYEIEAINDNIQRLMKDNGDWDATNDSYYITIIPDPNTLKSILNITNATYKVDFTVAGTIRELLGFDSAVYDPGYNVSQNPVNILSITNFYIFNSLVSLSTLNGLNTNNVFSFFPSVGPGYKIIETPQPIMYYPINNPGRLLECTTKLVDQTGRLLDLRGESLTVKFQIREVQ